MISVQDKEWAEKFVESIDLTVAQMKSFENLSAHKLLLFQYEIRERLHIQDMEVSRDA